MELIAVLLMCVVAALAFYCVVSRPFVPQRPPQDPAEPNCPTADGTRQNTAERGAMQKHKRP
jgi:hypothetical protein